MPYEQICKSSTWHSYDTLCRMNESAAAFTSLCHTYDLMSNLYDIATKHLYPRNEFTTTTQMFRQVRLAMEIAIALVAYKWVFNHTQEISGVAMSHNRLASHPYETSYFVLCVHVRNVLYVNTCGYQSLDIKFMPDVITWRFTYGIYFSSVCSGFRCARYYPLSRGWGITRWTGRLLSTPLVHGVRYIVFTSFSPPHCHQ